MDVDRNWGYDFYFKDFLESTWMKHKSLKGCKNPKISIYLSISI